jgi:triosephosphate isomerase
MQCTFSIVGHSERRELFNEDNDLIKKKIENLNNKIMTLLCVGESNEENEKGITKDILKDQLEVIKNLELDESFTVAYEPVWAIGSGLTPDPKDINEIHKYIKDVVQSNSANNLSPRVLYGGSVTDKNAESFFNEEFVDGALVGGASLDGTTFAKIVNTFNTTKEL